MACVGGIGASARVEQDGEDVGEIAAECKEEEQDG